MKIDISIKILLQFLFGVLFILSDYFYYYMNIEGIAPFGFLWSYAWFALLENWKLFILIISATSSVFSTLLFVLYSVTQSSYTAFYFSMREIIIVFTVKFLIVGVVWSLWLFFHNTNHIDHAIRSLLWFLLIINCLILICSRYVLKTKKRYVPDVLDADFF